MTSLSDKDRGVVAPVELQVGRQVENLLFVHGAPDEADEEDLHPAALQQVDAVDQLQLRVTCDTDTQTAAVRQRRTAASNTWNTRLGTCDDVMQRHSPGMDLAHVMTSYSDTRLGWTWPT